MEEEKAAAYYEELTRKGEGAARFKQGLGFSSSQSSDTITKGSSLTSSSSFLSSFVKASSPTKSSDIDKQLQLEKIQNKLKTKKQTSQRDDRDRDVRDRSSRKRSRSRDRYDSRHSRNDRDRDRDRGRSERRRRSRSRSYSDEERRHRPPRSSRERRRRRSKSRSSSPRDQRRSEKGRDEGKTDKGKSGGGVDYSRLIQGYGDMSVAERVKAKMKFQLSQTAEKDADRGMGAGWERFEFNKDAPLDDEEIEAAEDDAAVVKKMSQSFRFSAVEARREEQIKAAHDQAMFGAPVAHPSTSSDDEPTIGDERTTDNASDEKGTSANGVNSNLASDKVLAKQQGSWRDRARKLKDE